MTAIAFLGLGAMGAPMAARLVESGHEVTVWNRTPAKAQAFAGRAAVAASPAQAAQRAEVVITMVADPSALSDVLFGAGGVAGALGPGRALVDMSTVGPDHVLDVARRLPEGVELLDAPVLGSVANAVDGTLKVYVGGTRDAFSRWSEVLRPMGTPVHLGPLGSGAAMKLVANSTLAGLMGLVGEALALADGFGLEQRLVVEALLESPIGPALARKREKIERDHFEASFRLALMRKDLGLVRDAAARRDVELRVVEGAARWVEQAEREGLGDLDYSAVVAQVRGRRATG